MKTIKWIGSVILIFIFVGHLAAEQAEVIFFNGTVESAREKARNESKLYFIEFYAKWCEPCKWMDEHTFKNTALSSYVDANYVPVKVDVENIDGFVWKQKYKVQYLPTIIILNGEGNMLGKYEKSLAASDLLKILQNHRSAYREAESLSGVSGTNNGTATLASSQNAANYSAVPVKTTTTESAKPAFITVHREPGLPKATEVAKNTKPTTATIPAKTVSPKKKVASAPADGGSADQYRIQVGVYSDAANVFNEVNKLKKEFNQTVQVFNQKNKETNAVLYKITLGKFATREEAASFVEVLKAKGVNGVIRHMSDLEPKS
ncbi:MAG: thioredoxin family protein [Saprospiraceae bacterium]|nr:thioredoxin family protein [Saprospiraceae bacterium]